MRMIWASIVSLPTLVARKRKAPVWLMVAPITVSPARLVTGMGSPLTIDSSTDELPSTTSPSTGTFSPGRTTTRSPATTASIGMSASIPSRTTRAVRACIPISLRIASPVPALARASNRRPRRIRVMITPTASKYTSRRPAGSTPGATVTRRLYPKAAVVPTVISAFISADRWRRLSQPVRWIGQPAYSITGAIRASCSQRLPRIPTETRLPAITPNSTGAVSSAPSTTRRVRSAISALRSAVSSASTIPPLSPGTGSWRAGCVALAGARPTSPSASASMTRVPWTMFMPHAKANSPARSGSSSTAVCV
jgi:hypothetical protein